MAKIMIKKTLKARLDNLAKKKNKTVAKILNEAVEWAEHTNINKGYIKVYIPDNTKEKLKEISTNKGVTMVDIIDAYLTEQNK